MITNTGSMYVMRNIKTAENAVVKSRVGFVSQICTTVLEHF